MLRNSTKALLWVLLVFVIGAFFGAAVVRLSLRYRLVAENPTQPLEAEDSVSPEVPADGQRSRPPARRGLRPNVLQNMLQRLGMTPEQEAKAREILERSRSEYATVERRRNLAQRRIRRQALQELSEILEPEQRRRMRQFFGRLEQRPQPE